VIDGIVVLPRDRDITLFGLILEVIDSNAYVQFIR
jgi:hypothetical protein